MMGKFLIVHADDFGLSPGISIGILSSIDRGVVVSTSIIVKSPYLKDTVRHVIDRPEIDWGLHIVLNRGDLQTSKQFEFECERQLNIFENRFMITPSHIDFHKGFKFEKKIYFAARMFAMKHNLGFRYDNAHFLDTLFYGQTNGLSTVENISVSSLIDRIKSVNSGVTELVCHPGFTSNKLNDPYRHERSIEYHSLCSVEVREALLENKITLISYRDYVKNQKLITI